MATWGEFAEARPEMAGVLLGLLEWIPIAYLATVRRDGSPRVHPVCPIIGGGGMYVAVAGATAPAPSPKRFDLARDGRYALHALPGKRDDEFYVTGRARLIEDAATRRMVTDTAKHAIRADDWVFELEIAYAMTAYWEQIGEPGTYPVRTEWRAGG
ncbi:MAG TPA: pyridoxamine 5'-phosphate oxidase family protein [Dehalococcoidia bacterium]|nr:pyridoxamine 5'-phosphate oxidase family protein [Dehalococcoidia bacterium]